MLSFGNAFPETEDNLHLKIQQIKIEHASLTLFGVALMTQADLAFAIASISASETCTSLWDKL